MRGVQCKQMLWTGLEWGCRGRRDDAAIRHHSSTIHLAFSKLLNRQFVVSRPETREGQCVMTTKHLASHLGKGEKAGECEPVAMSLPILTAASSQTAHCTKPEIASWQMLSENITLWLVVVKLSKKRLLLLYKITHKGIGKGEECLSVPRPLIFCITRRLSG